jgi:cytochrome c oxidase subunit II
MENNNQPVDGNTKTQERPFPIIIIAAVVVIALLGIIAIKVTQGNSSNPSNNTDKMETSGMTPEQSAPTATPITTQDDSDAKIISVEAGSFYYKPNEIRVKKGEKVKINLVSKDMMHNFVVDELNVNLPITKAGETSSVVFTADKVGTFEYYCSVGQHRSRGQVGKIIVEE